MKDQADNEDLVITSHSIDGTFESCARRFEFYHMWLKMPEKEGDTFAADVGTALHEATQDWQRHLHGFKEGPFKEVNPVQAGALSLWRHWPWAWEEERRLKGQQIGERTFGNGVLMYDAIRSCSIWNEWELVMIEGFGPAIEVPFRIIHYSLGKVPTPYGMRYMATQGKMDFILRHKKTGAYRVLDLKSTEKSLPAHDAAFRFNGQVGQYGLVLSHALGLDWEENGLEVTYLILYFDPEQGPRVYPIDYSLKPAEVQDAIDLKVERLHRMKAFAEREHWPRRAHGCEFFGKPCAFLDICTRRDSDYIRQWFKFEETSGRFKNYHRVYDPVWTLEA